MNKVIPNGYQFLFTMALPRAQHLIIRSIIIADSSLSVGALIQGCAARQFNIDTFDETIVPPHYCGLCDQRCQFCGALYWKLELNSNRQYTKCCALGKAMERSDFRAPRTVCSIFFFSFN